MEPQGKVVKLGALSIGQTVKKPVTIANNSLAPLTFKLSFKSSVPELQEHGVRLLQVGASINCSCVLCWLPVCCPALPPEGARSADTCDVRCHSSPSSQQ